MLGHRRGHRIVQRFHAERNILNHAVDEKSRGGADVAQAPAGDVFANLLQVDVIIHLGRVARHIQAEPARIAFQIRRLQVLLVAEQHIVQDRKSVV